MCAMYVVSSVLLLMVFVLLVIMFLHINENVVVVPVVSFYQIERNYMTDMLTYVVNVAAPLDKDVVQRELIVTANGDVVTTRVLAGSSVDLGAFTVPQNANVTITVTDTDDAGNRSEPAVIDFVAVDTLSPQMPGGINVTLVSETPGTEDVNSDNG